MTRIEPVAVARWTEPEGVAPRGTVLIFPGRGEDAGAYWRLGPRLAYDAYRVVVVDPLTALDALRDADAVPVVVLGSDTGAVSALEFARAHPGAVSAAVVAGLPVGGSTDALIGHLGSRTACTVHQQAIGGSVATLSADGDTHLVARTLIDSVSGRIAVTARAGDLPVLGVHGSQDPVSPFETAHAAYTAIGVTELTVIDGGLHDIVNDLAHRTVAATLVTFLERIRAAGDATAIARDATVEWSR